MIGKIDLLEQKQILVEYLKMKVQQEDYHGVRDCCVDIEIIDAQITLLEKMKCQ